MRVARLRAFAAGVRKLPILLQDDPDPDGIASALAVRSLVHRRAPTAPIVTLGRLRRPENIRMARLLKVRIEQVGVDELRSAHRVVAVDVQPRALWGGETRVAVIDHHPREPTTHAELVDIRTGYGANATIMTEYLRADDERRINGRLATALLYGIQTDTALLTRGVGPADIFAYAFLQERADTELLHRIARPLYAEHALRAFGEALSTMVVQDELVVACLGELRGEDSHVLADLADLALSLEGARWAAVGALVDEELVITLRYMGTGPGAGAVARTLAGREGVGGGHATMARVALPAAEAWRRLGRSKARGPTAQEIAKLVRGALSPRSARRARPGSGR